MNTASQTMCADEYGDALMTVAQFCERYPHLYPNRSRVRWLLRDRNLNGLVETGAATTPTISVDYAGAGNIIDAAADGTTTSNHDSNKQPPVLNSVEIQDPETAYVST